MGRVGHTKDSPSDASSRRPAGRSRAGTRRPDWPRSRRIPGSMRAPCPALSGAARLLEATRTYSWCPPSGRRSGRSRYRHLVTTDPERHVTRRRIPEESLSAAHARAAARAAGDWDEADRLRAEIEAAGWKIADRGTDFALTPAAPPDLAEGERIRYGSSAGVPSRWDEPATGLATIVLIATDWPDDLARALAALDMTSPDGTSVVIVADGPSVEQAAALDDLETARSAL